MKKTSRGEKFVKNKGFFVFSKRRGRAGEGEKGKARVGGR
jgi:hypothetical protein